MKKHRIHRTRHTHRHHVRRHRGFPKLWLIIAIAIAIPLTLFALTRGSTDPRSRADSGATPTPTPDTTATPTVTVTPRPTNVPPRCNGLSAYPGAGHKPLTVRFTCAGYDPDNDITAAEFGFGGDEKQLVEKTVGQFGSISVTHTYESAGKYHVTCRVRDNNMAFSDYPSYCQYDITVTANALTPTPKRTPTPTREPEEPTATPAIDAYFPTAAPTSTPAATPTPIPDAPGFWTNEKAGQLIQMVMVSGIAIFISLLLYGLFNRK